MIYEHFLNIGPKNLLNISQLSDFFFFFWELQPFTSHATDPSRQRWSYLSLSNDVFWGVNADIGESSAFTRWKYSNVAAAWFSFSQSQMQEIAPATGRVRQIKADNYFSQLFVCSLHSRVGEWNKRKEEALEILQSIQKSCVKCTRGQKTWLICVPRRSGWVNWV